MKKRFASTLLACLMTSYGANALPYEESYCIVGEAGADNITKAAAAFLGTPIENLEVNDPVANRSISSALGKCRARYGWNEEETKLAFQFIIFSSADNVVRDQLYEKSFDVNIVDRVYKKEPALESMLGLWTLPEYRDALADRLKEAGVPDRSGKASDLIDEAMNLIRSRMLFEKVIQKLEFPFAEG